MISAIAIASWMTARFSSAPTTVHLSARQLDGVLDHLTRERDGVGALRRVAVHSTSRRWIGSSTRHCSAAYSPASSPKLAGLHDTCAYVGGRNPRRTHPVGPTRWRKFLHFDDSPAVDPMGPPTSRFASGYPAPQPSLCDGPRVDHRLGRCLRGGRLALHRGVRRLQPPHGGIPRVPLSLRESGNPPCPLSLRRWGNPPCPPCLCVVGGIPRVPTVFRESGTPVSPLSLRSRGNPPCPPPVFTGVRGIPRPPRLYGSRGIPPVSPLNLYGVGSRLREPPSSSRSARGGPGAGARSSA